MSVYLTNKRRDPFQDIDPQDFAELRKWKCEVKGPHCTGFGSQRHHGLVRRDSRFEKQLNVLINYQNSCENCHTGTCYADSQENHEKFLEMQRERYGTDVDVFFEILKAAGMYL